MTKSELADALAVHGRTVSKWLTQGMPVARPGGPGVAADYDLRAVRAWRDRRDRATEAERAKFDAARCRKELAQAAEAEQRVAQRAAKLITVEDVERTWASIVATVRARLTAIPAGITDRLCHLAVTEGVAAVEAELQRAVYDALRELAEDRQPKRRKARQ